MINVTATDILGSLFNPADIVCFRVFDDKKRGLTARLRRTAEVEDQAVIDCLGRFTRPWEWT